MANTTPTLDLLIFDTHNPTTLAIGDASTYPTGFNISTPTIEITVPGYNAISMTFVPSSVQVYNSTTLGITGNNCDNIVLPDGLYKIKYSLYPAFVYYTEKTFLRTDSIMAKYDEAWLKLAKAECSNLVTYQERWQMREIEDYLNEAIAAANKCANNLAVELYAKANKLITKFINNNSCLR